MEVLERVKMEIGKYMFDWDFCSKSNVGSVFPFLEESYAFVGF